MAREIGRVRWSGLQGLLLFSIIVGECFMARLMVKQFLVTPPARHDLFSSVVGLAAAMFALPSPLFYLRRTTLSLEIKAVSPGPSDSEMASVRAKIDSALIVTYLAIYTMAFAMTHVFGY
jgi:hypothetical protein